MILTSIGIKEIGVPWGKKWANDALVLLQKLMTAVPARMSRFIDNCVVGVNGWGNNPSKFIDPVNEINISAQVCPLWLWMFIICFDVSWTNHCWKDIRRLLICWLDVWKNMLRNIMIRMTIGSPIIVGVMKEANKFSFILLLKGCFVFVFL